jgi:hypothetical protein
VVQCASELSKLWPLRLRSGPRLPAKDAVAAE